MPPVSRYFLKSGFIWLVVSMLLYGFQQVEPNFRIAYHHSLGIGWVTQMIIGVAIWMFPRWSNELPKGPMWAWWLVFITLNSGLVLRLISEHFMLQFPSIMSPVLILSGILLWIAMMAFIIIMWKRVKPKFS
jgi:ABC-type Na+ efflux pump permease subunit